ncbi:ThuA domain-containing protein [Chloroflexi bacterium TSY]|nr:ThuA domain-containing protein [Chloroflexi bacterium TSY]
MRGSLASDKITAAVITGGHAFDVPGFHTIFREMPEVDSYIQHLDNWVADVAQVRDSYDVLLFYNMPRGAPAEESKTKAALEQLGTNGQGIFLLHHAILAYDAWPFWADLVGIQDRQFGYDMNQNLPIEITDVVHPITQDLASWQMVDETYKMESAGNDSHILLTTDHPTSMHTLGWTRKFRQSRVFCFQSGHDNQTYVNPSFRKVLLRGIQWCAGRI